MFSALVRTLAVVLAAASAAPVPAALTPESSRSIPVELTVVGDPVLSMQVESRLASTLRAIRDVQLVDHGAFFSIAVVVVPYPADVKPGQVVTLSTTVLSNFNNQALAKIIRSHCDEDLAALVELLTSSLVRLENAVVQMGPPKALAEMCQELVKTVNQDQFEALRELRKKLEPEPSPGREKPKTPAANTCPKKG